MATIDITQLLLDSSRGDQRAMDELFEVVYGELREIAQRYLIRENDGHSLEPTALVHEAYLRLVDQKRVDWKGKTHFRAVAAQMMQRVLIDHARAKNRNKRGGGWDRITLSSPHMAANPPGTTVAAVSEALERLQSLSQRQYRLAKLRIYSGMTMEEIAHALGVGKSTAEHEWTFVKAWLQNELSKGETR